MNLDTIYGRQVQLLVRLLPIIDTEKFFALKGGTAINLFYRDLPRPTATVSRYRSTLSSDRNQGAVAGEHQGGFCAHFPKH